jgi:hypothetical protein
MRTLVPWRFGAALHDRDGGLRGLHGDLAAVHGTVDRICQRTVHGRTAGYTSAPSLWRLGFALSVLRLGVPDRRALAQCATG